MVRKISTSGYPAHPQHYPSEIHVLFPDLAATARVSGAYRLPGFLWIGTGGGDSKISRSAGSRRELQIQRRIA
jgi:hypothetical protein